LLVNATLDIEYTDDDGRRWIDVSVRHPAAGDASAVGVAAKRAGEASRRGELEKHARYPGNRLTPFVLEVPGSIGAEARQWLLSQVRNQPENLWTFELTRA
jgi:hypothetical protein